MPDRYLSFFSAKHYRSGSLLFGALVLPSFVVGSGIRVLIGGSSGTALLAGILMAAGSAVFFLILTRLAAAVALREWGELPPKGFGLALLWRLLLLYAVFWIGNAFFPYGRIRQDLLTALLWGVNLLLLIHLVPMAHGFALRDVLARKGSAPPSLPFDLALFGLLLVMEAPIDFSIMIRNPHYLLAMFGGVLSGSVGAALTWSWPFIHIVLGYAVLTRQRWVFYLIIGGGVYALISAGFNYYQYGFGRIRTIFVSLIPLLMAYIWWRREIFLKRNPPPIG